MEGGRDQKAIDMLLATEKGNYSRKRNDATTHIQIEVKPCLHRNPANTPISDFLITLLISFLLFLVLVLTIRTPFQAQTHLIHALQVPIERVPKKRETSPSLPTYHS